VFICSSSAEKMSSIPIATYEEVKDLPNHPEKLLIDVREPAEIAETGSIPTAINIPRKSQGLIDKMVENS
jgi:rhodanese-related sulfurtransferase